jgi:hypothetical protein
LRLISEAMVWLALAVWTLTAAGLVLSLWRPPAPTR